MTVDVAQSVTLHVTCLGEEELPCARGHKPVEYEELEVFNLHATKDIPIPTVLGTLVHGSFDEDDYEQGNLERLAVAASARPTMVEIAAERPRASRPSERQQRSPS